MSNYAGPSIILSFIFAGICSFLAGMNKKVEKLIFKN